MGTSGISPPNKAILTNSRASISPLRAFGLESPRRIYFRQKRTVSHDQLGFKVIEIKVKHISLMSKKRGLWIFFVAYSLVSKVMS